MEPNKARYAQNTKARTLGDIIDGADVFLGCSTKGVLTKDMVKKMAARPLILALANPDPEITPEDAKAARPDCIIATGRSDYPNQVNNVLCFPFIFRGALDVGATKITKEMKLACVRALAELAQAEQSDIVAMAYGGQDLAFGPDYIIPRPFDPRLILRSRRRWRRRRWTRGVATRPIADFDAYRERLNSFVYHSAHIMSPVFHAAKQLAEARDLSPKARKSACCARCRSWSTRGSPADPHRPAGGDRSAHRALRPAPRGGQGVRDREPGERPALPRRLDRVSQADGPPRHHARRRQGARAAVPHADRRDADPPRRCRCDAVRHHRPLQGPPPARGERARARGGREAVRRDERPDARSAHRLHLRYLRQREPDRGRAGGDDR